MKSRMKKSMSVIVTLSLLLGLFAFGGETTQVQAEGMGNTTEVKAQTSTGTQVTKQSSNVTYQQFLAKQEKFSLQLLKQCNKEGENTLISPLSISAALAMAVLGADDTTLSQMLSTVMGGQSGTMTNTAYAGYMGKWIKSLTNVNKAKFHLANSIWLRNDDKLTVQDDFLNQNVKYLGAKVYRSDFNDETVKEINQWVKTNTAGMIPEIISEIQDTEKVILVNALSFQGTWAEQFDDTQVTDGIFTAADGTKQKVSMMSDSEYSYITVKNGTGFLKSYAKGYSYLALLPNKGVTVTQMLSTLNAATLLKKVKNPKSVQVTIQLPEYKVEQTLTLNDALKNMGMKDAFDSSTADFSKMAAVEGENMFISQVLHKTFIKVSQKGTKAGAVTAVIMDSACCPTAKIKTVILNRPFVYAIIDNHTGLPIFLGIQNTME